MMNPSAPDPEARGGPWAFLLVLFGVATADTLWVRLEHANWLLEPELFGGMLLLWGALALLALLPALLLGRLLRRFGSRGLFGPLLFVLLLPIVPHAILDHFTSLGSATGQLHSARPWLLAGLGVLGLALVAWGLAKLVRWARLETAPRAALVLLIAGIIGLVLPRRTTHTGAVVPGQRPNLMLIVVDTVRAKSLAAFAGARQTMPSLASLAETGTRYLDTRSVSSFTYTSHLSMLSGVWPSEHGAWLLDMRYDPARAPSLAATLNQAGYRTGAFVGTDVLSARFGLDWGFERYRDRVDPGLTYGLGWSLIHDLQALAAARFSALSFDGRPHWIQDFQQPADASLEAAAEWIAEPSERPYFCMLNLYDAHWPYLPDAASREALVRPYSGPIDGSAERKSDLPAGYELTPADDLHLADLYEAELLELDGKLGRFLAGLDLERTAVVIVADHGEAFGEGGRYEHNDLIPCQVHVPLIVRPAGGLAAAETSSAPVSGIDVAPTLMGLAGLEKPSGMRGLDLVHETPDPARLRLIEDRDHLSPDANHFAILRGNFKFVRVGSAAEGAGLFDLESDPEGLVDVSAEFPELAAELAGLLESERARWGADDEQLQRGTSGAEGLGALGYLGD